MILKKHVNTLYDSFIDQLNKHYRTFCINVALRKNRWLAEKYPVKRPACHLLYVKLWEVNLREYKFVCRTVID